VKNNLCTFITRVKIAVLAVAILCISFTVTTGEAEAGFNKSLNFGKIVFHVSCPNESSLNDVTIVVKGLGGDTSIVRRADGAVTGAEAADLNSDGFPEIYIYVTSAGSGSYGSLVAYSTNKNKPLSEIYLQPFDNNEVNFKGYMGHDFFTVSEGYLTRSFPVYNDGDTNVKPTGGIRRLRYKLVFGEAGWQLRLMKIQGTL